MKRGIVLSFLFLILVFILVTTFSNNSLTGNVVSEPSNSQNCSISEIKKVWDSIFVESSTGITILTDNSTIQDQCGKYFAYKSSGVNNYILSASTNPNNETRIYAYYGNFLDGFKNIIKNFNSINDVNIIDSNGELTKNSNFFIGNLYPRVTPLLIQYADANFGPIFKIETDKWESKTLYNAKYFEFSKNYSQFYVSNISGTINSNYTFAEVIYLKKPKDLSDCSTTWIKQNTSCTVNENYTIYYVSGNSCTNQTGKPQNQTGYCDFNDNSLIGNASEIKDINTEVSVEIDNEDINESQTYSGEQKVEILDSEGDVIVKFNWDFSEPLNLKTLYVEQQDEDSGEGYIIVRGINASKTVKVDQILGSDALCIKDEEIESLENISSDCDEDNEYLISCPGEENSFDCTLKNNTFTISGLKHSAVVEYNEDSTVCNPVWTCGEWSACDLGTQTRECIDENLCGTNSGRPPESRNCISTSCTPNWDCTEWTPEKCPQNETRTRECNDLNNCGETTDLTQACTYGGTKATKLFLVSLLIVFIIIFIIIGLILYFMSQRNQIPLT